MSHLEAADHGPPPADTAPELSVRVTSMIILEFEERFGRTRLEELFEREGLTLSTEYLKNPRNYVSLSFVERLTQLLVDASGDPEFVRRAGMRVASREALGFVYYAFKAFGSPGLLYAKLVDFTPSMNKVGGWQIEAQDRGAVTLVYTSSVQEQSRHFCEGRQAQLASVPTLWGLPAAQVTETECLVGGGKSCRYVISFHEPVQTWRRWILGFAGLGAGLGAGLLEIVTPVEAVTALGAAVGYLLGAGLDLRAALRLKAGQFESQDEALSGSVKDLEQRYEELYEVKLDLERRVEARTRQLSEANDQLTEALAKQHELDRVKTRFFTNISHELRTPLTLIMAPLETMLGQDSLPAEVRGEIEIVYRNALRLLNYINELLDLARLDAGKERLRLEETDVPEQLRGLVESCRGLADKRGVALDFQVVGEVPRFEIDRKKVERVFLNLVANALRFVALSPSEPRRVSVRCGLSGDRFSFSVEDTGPGISSDQLPHIFERFQQAHSTVTEAHKGTGIGLALVKELTELHCGQVEVNSIVDEGTTFTVELPTSAEVYAPEQLDRRQRDVPVDVDRRAPAEQRLLHEMLRSPSALVLADLSPVEVQSSPDEKDHAATKPVILAVDDNRDMLNLLSRLLAPQFKVITAEDGEQAFRLALQEQPSLVLSDVNMPRRGGRELVQDLRREPRTANVPVILLTAAAEQEAKVAGLEEGADDYVGKPFHFDELQARIRSLLRRRELEMELEQKNSYLTRVNFDLMLSEKEVFLQTIQALALAVEAKDPYTHGHSRRVSILAHAISRELALSEVEQEQVRVAAVLHDVGKIGVPESILNKPARLEDGERRVVERHPTIGQRILETVHALDDVGHIILFHHERYDGDGYPNGATKEDIPLGARIIAVADTYDAMTSHRSYRRGLKHEIAVEEIQRCAGQQFDPLVAEAFLGLWGTSPPEFPEIPYAFPELGAEGSV